MEEGGGVHQPADYDNPNAQIVSCDSGGKYALDVAKVPGTQIATAAAELSTTSNQWEVLVTLKGAGATAFANLTAEQAAKYYSAGGATLPGVTSGWTPSRSSWTGT